MKLYFTINYRTNYQDILQLIVMEENKEPKVCPMDSTDGGNWQTEIDYFSKTIIYHYNVINPDGSIVDKELSLHRLSLAHSYNEFKVYDVWNQKNFPENYLNNKILKNSLLHFKSEKVSILKKHTHHFRIEAPIFKPNWRIVLLGSGDALGNWNYAEAVPMCQTSIGVWEVGVSIPDTIVIYYKYGLLDTQTGELIDIEYGDNRWVFPNNDEGSILIKSDHFFRYKSWELYHAAGVAIPVFSLRSEKGFGVGEFADIKELATWANDCNLKIMQFLPINDTTNDYSWADCYPYAGISVHSLHPLYLSFEELSYSIPENLKQDYEQVKAQLNALPQIDYEKVIAYKWKFIRAIFEENKKDILKDRGLKKFLKENHWLLPYSVFCVQRDKYKTADYTQWKRHKKFIHGKILTFTSPKCKDYETTMLYAWVQYELHLQFKNAVGYAHSLGISLKGDLPIGVNRYSVDTWMEPELFELDFQAGAPPDFFSAVGQNWSFPTYNWDRMKEDDYAWWKRRFSAMQQYFDALRIDHILGFFRIWRIPYSATQSILGYFYPSIPIAKEELDWRGLTSDERRYTAPYVDANIMWDYFGEEQHQVANEFFDVHPDGHYSLKEQYNSQRKIEQYFRQNPNPKLEENLIALCINVLLIIEEKNGEHYYHPRFNHSATSSFQHLSEHEKKALNDLSREYFGGRQEKMWRDSAMEKLPPILDATEMLLCGEELGMVPSSVPEIMDKLAINSLKIQRLYSGKFPWYDPREATYLNVVSTSSHDSSTLRQWWEEDRCLIERYFHEQLGQTGTAPEELLPPIVDIILQQHFYTDAMLAIFPMQDLLASDYQLVGPHKEMERINDPGIFPYKWRYRMHLNLSQLIGAKDFNAKLSHWVKDSGRA